MDPLVLIVGIVIGNIIGYLSIFIFRKIQEYLSMKKKIKRIKQMADEGASPWYRHPLLYIQSDPKCYMDHNREWIIERYGDHPEVIEYLKAAIPYDEVRHDYEALHTNPITPEGYDHTARYMRERLMEKEQS